MLNAVCLQGFVLDLIEQVVIDKRFPSVSFQSFKEESINHKSMI